MPDIHCPVDDCTYNTGDEDNAVAAALLMAHTAGSHNSSQGTHQRRRPPKVDRPRLVDTIGEETWNSFKQDWEMFIRANDVEIADQSIQLFLCCDTELKAKVTAICPDIFSKTVSEILILLKSLAVIPVAVSVKRNKLLQMHQDAGETVRTFLSRVKGKAVTCRFTVECTHAHRAATGETDPPAHVYVDYTNEMIRHVILNGLYDDEIRRDIFGQATLDTMAINDLISMIEGKETAREATLVQSANAFSQFKRRQKDESRTYVDYERKGKCNTCKLSFKMYKKMANGKFNKKPFADCQDCWKKKSRPTKNHNIHDDENITKESSAVSFHICTNGDIPSHKTVNRKVLCKTNSKDAIGVATNHDASNCKTLVLNHHVFENGDWRLKVAQPHPTILLEVSTDHSDYEGFGYKNPDISDHPIKAIVDSGAQCCLWGWNDCKAAGFTGKDILPVKQKLNAVSKLSLHIHGAVILRMTGVSATGKKFSCAVIVYISPDVSGFYLSKEAMIQLQIVPADFPSVGGALSLNANNTESQDSVITTGTDCTCPYRSLPPGLPDKLPFESIPQNVDKMRQWLLNRYAASTFNTCPHQILPDMQGPPVRIHVDPEATPVAAHTPAQIPLHWQEQVEHDIKRDEALGVIEKVPHGEPSKWCHRMVITRKENGDPRRTVDLSPLNKHCVREVHAMRSPFELAKGVPDRTWRTVTDAWNGFHSVPLGEEDRHLTTFITPWGRFRYKRAPQGFASSGDGYNRRFDEVLSDFQKQKRCVDDTLIFDDDLGEHWWRTLEFLELVGRNGIVLNPVKFQFCQRQVDFAGFRIKETGIEPLPKYLDAIRNFPTPKSITDIRSWFGLVNQVSHYAQLRDLIEPFRKFLSPKVKFYWNDELNDKFKDSQILILEAINEGVKNFDPKRKTCLRCDWSKLGIGFYLCQKHCSCDVDYPDCCIDGWRITLCGSRFLRKSEERYAPIEGEALSVAWALEQTKFFTLGCDDLLVVVDHKPLTKLLGDRTLDEIPNTRLFRLKQRTLPWIYKIIWMPGKGNFFSDATSRHPVDSEDDVEINSFALMMSSMMETVEDLNESIAMVQVKSDLNKVTAITWERLQEATHAEYGDLLTFIQQGFCTEKDHLDSKYAEFWEYRGALYVYDDVIMYQDRVVVPPSLRAEVMDSLHAAHQGKTAMMLTAQSTVFWPGISVDIERTRGLCNPCVRNAPSQPKLTPVSPIIPTTPFEAIVADYFDYKGKHYLVIADRLSGWTEIYHIKVGSKNSGGSGLVLLLKKFFGTFGVPEELSSDQGTEFMANETQDFLIRWGVKHRDSSAYHPQSNGRAELAVKSTKRLLEDNIGQDGELDTDNFIRALLIKRNTPDPACKLSPAEIIFGRKLRDTMPRINKDVNIFFNKELRTTWRDAWEQKELALRTRYQGCQKRLGEHSKALPILEVGDRVAIQNQSGRKPSKWERTGTVVEVRDYDKYVIKVDGSGRLTMRNRRFLKKLYHDKAMFGSPSPTEFHRADMKDKVQLKASNTLPLPTVCHQEEDQLKAINPVLPLVAGDLSHQPTCATPLPHLSPPSRHKDVYEQRDTQSDSPASHLQTPTTLIGSTPTKSYESFPTSDSQIPLSNCNNRPIRIRKQKLVYDPATGSYIERNPTGKALES